MWNRIAFVIRGWPPFFLRSTDKIENLVVNWCHLVRGMCTKSRFFSGNAAFLKMAVAPTDCCGVFPFWHTKEALSNFQLELLAHTRSRARINRRVPVLTFVHRQDLKFTRSDWETTISAFSFSTPRRHTSCVWWHSPDAASPRLSRQFILWRSTRDNPWPMNFSHWGFLPPLILTLSSS